MSSWLSPHSASHCHLPLRLRQTASYANRGQMADDRKRDSSPSAGSFYGLCYLSLPTPAQSKKRSQNEPCSRFRMRPNQMHSATAQSSNQTATPARIWRPLQPQRPNHSRSPFRCLSRPSFQLRERPNQAKKTQNPINQSKAGLGRLKRLSQSLRAASTSEREGSEGKY